MYDIAEIRIANVEERPSDAKDDERKNRGFGERKKMGKIKWEDQQ